MVLFLYVISGLVSHVMSHAQMVDPPARPYLSQAYPNRGFYPEYYYNKFNCGGRFVHRVACQGLCGVCGDSCNDPNPANVAGGRYATGFISRTYQQGQVVNTTIQVTANHNGGYFEFRICPNNDVTKPVTHSCLNQHTLQLADGSGTRYNLPHTGVGNYIVSVRLPPGMSCSQCVIQWRMHTANDWGRDSEHPSGCTGCGMQEEFYGCADVAIETGKGNGQETGQGTGTTNGLYHLFG